MLTNFRMLTGCLHLPQLCEKPGGEKVDVEEEVELGQEVFVKVLTVDVESQKVVSLTVVPRS